MATARASKGRFVVSKNVRKLGVDLTKTGAHVLAVFVTAENIMSKFRWLGLAAALASKPAFAQTNLPSELTDGMYITLAEIRSNSMDAFEVFAGPQGGPISKQQFLSPGFPKTFWKTSLSGPFWRLFTAMDANGDGQVALSEWRSRTERDLQFADGNGDGRVTLKELANARKSMSFGESLGLMF
ncbi:hypothetical protein ABVV53_10780 [Novosphingobium sp. RD2P27]|uniref:EF-hand domain-containing protein n=1 Tax=Novosphingobium kalidii TaxID=3230299 RepID=A0ABV2D2B2_9SPHN